MRHGSANKKFTIAGARNSTRRVVRVGAGADNRRITDAAGFFVCRSPGRRRRGEISALIERNRADRTMSILVRDDKFLFACSAAFFSLLNFLERIPAFLREKIFLVDQRNAVFLGKGFSAFTRHQERTNTRRFHGLLGFFHEHPREADRITNVPQICHCPCFERFAIHDCRVQFVRSGAGKHRAFAGIEMRVVFEYAHRSFGGIDARPAVFQNVVAGLQRALQASAIFALAFRRHRAARNCSGAAVDNEPNFFRFWHVCFFRRRTLRG